MSDMCFLDTLTISIPAASNKKGKKDIFFQALEVFLYFIIRSILSLPPCHYPLLNIEGLINASICGYPSE